MSSSALQNILSEVADQRKQIKGLEARTQLTYVAVTNVTTSPYNVANYDQLIVCDGGESLVTVNLPAATGTGRMIWIKNIGATNVTVDGSGAETIDGATTQVLGQWDDITVVDYASGAWVSV